MCSFRVSLAGRSAAKKNRNKKLEFLLYLLYLLFGVRAIGGKKEHYKMLLLLFFRWVPLVYRGGVWLRIWIRKP